MFPILAIDLLFNWLIHISAIDLDPCQLVIRNKVRHFLVDYNLKIMRNLKILSESYKIQEYFEYL